MKNVNSFFFFKKSSKCKKYRVWNTQLLKNIHFLQSIELINLWQNKFKQSQTAFNSCKRLKKRRKEWTMAKTGALIKQEKKKKLEYELPGPACTGYRGELRLQGRQECYRRWEWSLSTCCLSWSSSGARWRSVPCPACPRHEKTWSTKWRVYWEVVKILWRRLLLDQLKIKLFIWILQQTFQARISYTKILFFLRIRWRSHSLFAAFSYYQSFFELTSFMPHHVSATCV